MDKSISKEQSKILQGLAVLMMLFHHLFSEPMNLTLLTFINPAFCQRLAWLFKLCVVTFAFLSGYGMNTGTDSSTLPDLKKLYKQAFTRILRLYIILWVMMILLIGGQIVFSGLETSPYEFIMNGLGLLYTYNGAWWYVFFYVLLCIGFPIIRLYLTRIIPLWKKAVGLVIMAAAVGLFYLAANHLFFPYLMIAFMYLQVALHPSIMLAFFAGIIVSEFALYDKALAFLNRGCKGKLSELLIRVVLPDLVILGLCILRMKLADSAAYSTIDFALIPFLILAFLLLTSRISLSDDFLCRILSFFGTYSTGMWLDHILIWGLTYEAVATVTKHSIPFFLAEVLLSLAVSMAVTTLIGEVTKLVRRK